MNLPRLTKPTPLVSYETFKFYRENNKEKFYSKHKDIVTEKTEFRKIAYALCREIARQFVNSSYGLVLDGIGYLCIWRSPERSVMKRFSGRDLIIDANLHTDGYQYHPTLMTDIMYNNPLVSWSMDRAFNVGIRRAIRDVLFRGEKYYFDIKTVKTFNKSKNLSKKLKCT